MFIPGGISIPASFHGLLKNTELRLVIPYRLSGDGVELRYAIRSMQKHFTALSGVLLIGDRPEWFTGEHIPCADIKGQKERSIQNKVLQCPDEIFLYSNDDFFALQPFDLTLPNYYDTTCNDMASRHPIHSYRDMYGNCPGSWLNFDIHTPIIINRAKFKQSYYSMDGQTPIKTTYGNYGQKLPGTYLHDFKITGRHSEGEINELIKYRPFFSTHDSSINVAFIASLNYLYPNASDYEK